MQNSCISLQGPVERRGDQLILRIPLHAGGDQLLQVAQASSFVEGDKLVVVLPDWLAQRMQLDEGSEVVIDDRWGKLHVTRLQ